MEDILKRKHQVCIYSHVEEIWSEGSHRGIDRDTQIQIQSVQMQIKYVNIIRKYNKSYHMLEIKRIR